MNNYKRLTNREKKKLELLKKSKKVFKKGAKWWLVIFSTICLFLVGLFAFYKWLDNKNGDSQKSGGVNSVNSKVSADDREGLGELEKKELERESEKAGKLSQNQEASDFKGADFSAWNSSCAREMIVVNKDNALDESFRVKTKSCRGKEIAIEAYQDLDNMISDAKKQGINLWISSGYRDINLQTKLFGRQIEREKSKAVISQQEAENRAARVVARPGTSEHNTGLAVDFNGVCDNFYTTREYKWLMDNAHKYGFIERYQKKWKDRTGVIYEPWHFRYVGRDAAPKIKESGLCLEQYAEENFIKK